MLSIHLRMSNALILCFSLVFTQVLNSLTDYNSFSNIVCIIWRSRNGKRVYLLKLSFFCVDFIVLLCFLMRK